MDKIGDGLKWLGFWIMLGLLFHGGCSFNTNNKLTNYIEEHVDGRAE